MTDDDRPTSQELTSSTRQSQAIDGRSSPLKVTGKLRIAIEQMVWHGARRAEAAEKAGLKDHSLRAALRKGHVMAHYHAELGVLRESARARNFHRLDDIAESSPNAMAKVAAIKVMEAISEPLASVASLSHAPAGLRHRYRTRPGRPDRSHRVTDTAAPGR